MSESDESDESYDNRASPESNRVDVSRGYESDNEKPKVFSKKIMDEWFLASIAEDTKTTRKRKQRTIYTPGEPTESELQAVAATETDERAHRILKKQLKVFEECCQRMQ